MGQNLSPESRRRWPENSYLLNTTLSLLKTARKTGRKTTVNVAFSPSSCRRLAWYSSTAAAVAARQATTAGKDGNLRLRGRASRTFNFRETSLDLHEFYKEVTQRGGLHEVTAKEKWGEIASIMNSKCNVKLSANQLQTLYGMTLYQFEQTYHYPSPSPSAPKSPGYGSDKEDGAGFDDEDDHSREKLLTAKKRKKEKHSSSLINREVGAAFEIPEELKQLLNAKKGSNPVFVIQKQLFGSDVDPNKGRLSLPLSQLSGEFLTQDEKDFLSKQTRVGGKKPRIQARIFEPCGEEREICVAKWKMGSVIYSFISAWNQVVKMNALRNGMHIQLWSFRVDSQLCFFLLKVMER